ncbi:MAG TPA: CCC motif membrane protein [Bacteroidales bacterium]|nr:CCC motif membrane protein [Bacteroidales bacterium]HNS46766.1 CCC motif membrane protein [Bacteroidales bacterium]
MENTTDPTNQANGSIPASAPSPVQEVLPNSTAVLIMGILSIIVCCGLGLVLSIIALVMASKGKRLYEANPGKYAEGSYNNMKAGKICAIIGLIINLLVSLYYLIVIVIIGAAFSFIPWEMCTT